MTEIIPSAVFETGISKTLNAFDQLELPLPQALEEALEQYSQAALKVRGLDARMPTHSFTHHDLNEPDWTKRLHKAAEAQTASKLYRSIADKALKEHGKQVQSVARKSKEELFVTLEQWYTDHVEELAQAAIKELHPAEQKALDTKERHFQIAHMDLLGRLPAMSGSAEWFFWFAWTPQTFKQLVDNTRPNYQIYTEGTNLYETGLRSGGVPRLVRSKDQLLDEHRDSGPGTYKHHQVDRSEQQRLAASRAEWSHHAKLAGAEVVNQ